MAVALHHRLAGKKVLTPENLKEERLLMMRKGWSCHVDALRAELTEKYPEITIADFDFYNVDIFTSANITSKSKSILPLRRLPATTDRLFLN